MSLRMLRPFPPANCCSFIQVEKVSHAVATRLLSSLGEIEKVGASLGSFSVSSLLVDVSVAALRANDPALFLTSENTTAPGCVTYDA